MPTANVFNAEFQYDDDDPDGYHAGAVLIGQIAGGRDNVVKAFQLPPGQSICPYCYGESFKSQDDAQDRP